MGDFVFPRHFATSPHPGTKPQNAVSESVGPH